MSSQDSSLKDVYDLVLAMEAAMKIHYECFLEAMETQRPIVERMHNLVQRYIILSKGAPSKRTYPNECDHRVENDIRKEFHQKRSLLDDSNAKLSTSLMEIMEKYNCLGEQMKGMDCQQVSSPNKGGSTRPPASYFVELFSDFLKFFTRTQSKMNCFAGLLTADNTQSVNTYKKLLDISGEFKDHFGKALAYCSCLHTKAKT